MKALSAIKSLPKNEGHVEDEEPELPRAEDERVKFTFYIHPDVHQRLRRYTGDHNTTIQSFLEDATHHWMGEKGLAGWPKEKRNLRKQRKNQRKQRG